MSNSRWAIWGHRTEFEENMIPQTTVPTVSTRQRIFPLHLTPFENYMFLDDRPSHPMTFVIQLVFSGDLNVEAFEEAFRFALSRHPLLSAVIQPAKQNRDCWVSAGDLQPKLDFGGLDDPITFDSGEYIDLRREVGLRIWIRSDKQRAVVTSQFHHATCDGIGANQFLGDLLWSYASRTGGETVKEPIQLDPGRLRARWRASYSVADFRSASGRIQTAWGETAKLLFKPATSLKPPSARSKSHGLASHAFPGVESYKFDQTETCRLRQAAHNRGQSTNELLLEKLFQTLAHWNRRRGAFPSPRSICVMMPLNMRQGGDNLIPAANIVSFAFLRRSRSAIDDPELLRASLRQEAEQVKRDRHRLRFTHVLAASQYLHPKLLRASLRFSGCMSTAVMSNSGDPGRSFYVEFPRHHGVIRCGNLKLEDISRIPPLRPKTRVTVSTFTYGRILKICMRCDPHLFSLGDTQDLLNAMVRYTREDVLSS